MAKTLSGETATKPDTKVTTEPEVAAAPPEKKMTLAELGQHLKDKEDAEKAAGDKASTTPAAEVVPAGASAAAASNDKAAELKERTLEAIRVDIFHYFASRAEPDWANLDEVHVAVNEPGTDGAKRAHVAKGVVDKIVERLVEQRRLETELTATKVKRFRMTAATRREIDSPAIVRSQRTAIMSVLLAGLVYSEATPMPVKAEGMKAWEIAYALMLGSAKGAEADKARAEGRSPTLPDGVADDIRIGLATVPEKDPASLVSRVVEHLGRLLEVGMVGAPPSADATLASALGVLAANGEIKLTAEIAPDAKQLFTPTSLALSKLFTEGVGGIVDATFPPKKPRPTIEELERLAEDRAQTIIAALKKSVSDARAVAATHEATARVATRKMSAIEAWFNEGGVKNAHIIISTAIDKFEKAAISAVFEVFDWEEEVVTNDETAFKIQAELTALKAELVRVVSRHTTEKKGMALVEDTLKSKIEERVRIMDAWGAGDRIRVTIKKRARTFIEYSECVVKSEDDHDRGRVLSRKLAPPNTQLSIAGAGLPNQYTPTSSAPAPGTAPAGAAPAAAPVAPAPPAEVKAEPLAIGAATMPGRWDKPLDLTAKGLVAPLEAFMLGNTRGIYATDLEGRFFEWLGTSAPNKGVVTIFMKVFEGGLKKGTFTKAEGGEKGILYWHTTNPDPRLTDADKAAAAPATPRRRKKTSGRPGKSGKAAKAGSGKG